MVENEFELVVRPKDKLSFVRSAIATGIGEEVIVQKS